MSGREEMEIKFRNKINNVVADNLTLKHYVNYLDSLSVRTKYTYTCIVAAFLKYINKNETNLIFDDFNDYMSYIKYLDNNETKTASYMITVYSALKKFSEYLYITKRIPENYMNNIKRPKSIEKQKTIQKRENGFLNKKEIHKMTKNIYMNPSHKRSLADKWKTRNCAIIYLFLVTGIRCSALAAIDINDIDFNSKLLVVTDKGSKVKKCDLSDKICDILKEWIKERSNIENVNNNALFISNRKERMSTQAIALMVHTYADMSEIENKNITPHKLRATYGTNLYKETGDIYLVKECMGHESVNTTKLYIRGENESGKRAAEIMTSIL